MAATAISCFALPSKFRNLSLNASSSCIPVSPSSSTFRTLTFSSNISVSAFSSGCLSISKAQRPHRYSVVCEAAPKTKADSAAKRARQAEKRRIYNKARKSEIKTRIKKG